MLAMSERNTMPPLYTNAIEAALETVRREGRYREFADIKRQCGSFPRATHYRGDATREITVWCSNDYLGSGWHAEMHRAVA